MINTNTMVSDGGGGSATKTIIPGGPGVNISAER